MTARALAKERQRDDLVAQVSKVEAESGHHQAQVKQNQLEIADLTGKIAELSERRVINRQADKYLHNRKLELKGNIRVFCRVRPILPHELQKADQRAAKNYMPSSATSKARTIQVRAKARAGERVQPAVADTYAFKGDKRVTFTLQSGGAPRTTSFKFDRVFNDSETQEAVYDEVKDVVRSALDGYNVCIFAYGQTGAGKTHTMQGEKGTQAGIVPRAVHLIFEKLKSNQQIGSPEHSRVFMSCYELHIENVRDLLNPNN